MKNTADSVLSGASWKSSISIFVSYVLNAGGLKGASQRMDSILYMHMLMTNIRSMRVYNNMTMTTRTSTYIQQGFFLVLKVFLYIYVFFASTKSEHLWQITLRKNIAFCAQSLEVNIIIVSMVACKLKYDNMNE